MMIVMILRMSTSLIEHSSIKPSQALSFTKSEYKLDFNGKYLSARGYEDKCENIRTLKFEQIKAGLKITDKAALLGHIDVATVVSIFTMLSADEKKEALHKIIDMMH